MSTEPKESLTVKPDVAKCEGPTKEQVILAKTWAEQYLTKRVTHPNVVMIAVARVVLTTAVPKPEPPRLDKHSCHWGEPIR